MMGAVERFKTNDLTRGEKIVLDFVLSHPGETFTAYDIESETGVRANVVPWIMENLRYKGHKVNSKNGKHWVSSGSWKGYVLLALIFGAMFTVFFVKLLEILDRGI